MTVFESWNIWKRYLFIVVMAAAVISSVTQTRRQRHRRHVSNTRPSFPSELYDTFQICLRATDVPQNRPSRCERSLSSVEIFQQKKTDRWRRRVLRPRVQSILMWLIKKSKVLVFSCVFSSGGQMLDTARFSKLSPRRSCLSRKCSPQR